MNAVKIKSVYTNLTYEYFLIRSEQHTKSDKAYQSLNVPVHLISVLLMQCVMFYQSIPLKNTLLHSTDTKVS